MLLGLLLGVSTAFFQALSYIFMRKSLQEFPASVSFFMNALTGVLIWIPFALLTNGNWNDLPSVLPIALISAVLSEAFVFYATSKGDSITTGVLFSTYPIFTILFASVLLSEELVTSIWIILGLIILGTLIVAAPSRANGTMSWQAHLILWPLLGALSVGLSDVMGKNIIDKTSAGTFLMALALAEIPVSLIFLRLQNQKISQLKKFVSNFHQYKFAFLSGLLGTITVLLLWLTFEALPASVASPLTAITPIFVFVLGILFLKEKVTLKNSFGLTVVTCGILLLSIYAT